MFRLGTVKVDHVQAFEAQLFKFHCYLDGVGIVYLLHGIVAFCQPDALAGDDVYCGYEFYHIY